MIWVDHNNHKKWIPWIEDDNYLVGIAKVIKVPIIILRLVFWWCTNLHVPVSYGEKPRTEDKLKCIVMSHGLGGNRFLYSKVCCDLASRGFLVACLEHRDNSASYTYYYDSDEKAKLDNRTVIEFQHIPFGQKHYQSRNSQIRVRASECSKIMDVLKNLNEGSIPHNVLKSVHGKKTVDFDLKELIGKIDTENFTLMGHSFGAATALYTSSLRDDVRQCILLDPWMFPIKDEKLEDRIKFPILFLNTQTFHIESNVKTMAKFLTNETVEMYTILGTTHENQTDSVLVVGYWLNWMMRKIDPHLALKINNALILTFLHRCMKTPADIQESEQFLEAMKEFYEEGLTKPWL
nr:platelet-activating factor acetylhydrolase-like [Leptinotarsa decemlineata]